MVFLFFSRLVLIWLQRMQNVIVCLNTNFLQMTSMGVIRGQKLLFWWTKGENCIFSSVSVDNIFIWTFSTILKSASNIASVDSQIEFFFLNLALSANFKSLKSLYPYCTIYKYGIWPMESWSRRINSQANYFVLCKVNNRRAVTCQSI